MKITFKNPPTNTLNPFQDFNPSNVNHYPDSNGIYVYGLKLIVENKETFIPLYVGIGNLKKRLFNDHYKQESFPGKKISKKEIFDFSNSQFTLQEIIDKYYEMNIYDDEVNVKKSKNPIPIISRLQNLIWYQNITFYNSKFNTIIFNSSKFDTNHLDSISQNGIFNSIKNNLLQGCKQKIINTKNKFNIDYYYVYADLYKDVTDISEDINNDEKYKKWNDKSQYTIVRENVSKKVNGPGKNLVERIELATKNKLKSINIHTTAKANGANIPMQIDLTCIQNNLINLTSQDFPKKLIL